VVVRLNPWWFSGREQFLQQFFRQFRAALGDPDAPGQLKKVAENLDRLVGILEPLTLLPWVGGWTGRVKDWLKSIGRATTGAADLLKEDIQKTRATIDKLLAEQDARILVVIDDIDRLRPGEVREVFQLVKAIADFPKTIYLLAFDRRKVVRALE